MQNTHNFGPILPLLRDYSICKMCTYEILLLQHSSLIQGLKRTDITGIILFSMVSHIRTDVIKICIMLVSFVQKLAKVGAPDLVNSIPAVACLNLPAAFTKPGSST